ncbi:MAG: NAD(P)H-dependent oxidoreductase [Pseudomonadota bacterium]|nr:NAD(P)H-dependent oxidoreductase [Pseudomonadota bacterium]
MIRVAAIAGSYRTDSYNRTLLAIGVTALRLRGVEVDLIDLRALALPVYDGDLEADPGPPAGAIELKARIRGAQALLIASPEYNGSIPGGLKNAIDWASRAPDAAFGGKVAAIMGASPGGLGSVRGLAHLRQCLTALDVWVVPSQVTVPAAHKAFAADGSLLDPRTDEQVTRLVERLLESVARLG